jgi:hypothetical protein
MKETINDTIKYHVMKCTGPSYKMCWCCYKHYYLRLDDLKPQNNEVFYDENNMWIECYEGKNI